MHAPRDVSPATFPKWMNPCLASGPKFIRNVGRKMGEGVGSRGGRESSNLSPCLAARGTEETTTKKTEFRMSKVQRGWDGILTLYKKEPNEGSCFDYEWERGEWYRVLPWWRPRPMDLCDVEMRDQWGASDAPPMRIGGLWLAEEWSSAVSSKTSPPFFFLGLWQREGVGGGRVT